MEYIEWLWQKGLENLRRHGRGVLLNSPPVLPVILASRHPVVLPPSIYYNTLALIAEASAMLRSREFWAGVIASMAARALLLTATSIIRYLLTE